MKIASRILSLLILVMITTFYMGCKKDDDNTETEEKKQLDKLKSVWTIVSANDGADRTVDFTDPNDLVLTLAGNYVEGGTYNYSFTGTRPTPSPWPVNGNWKFGTNKSTQIIRDPGSANEIEMTYQVTATELIILFNIPDGHPGWAGSRVGSVTGDWTFTFTK
ncbi:MAG: hypothetical protein WD824_16915 [Cyclobacteriaceae bacterium]